MKVLMGLISFIRSIFSNHQNPPMVKSVGIPKEKLRDMFSNISAKTNWDLNGKLLWGYFFTNGTRGALDKGKEVLELRGYRFVDIYENDGVWWLHVEKEEVHTVDSLYMRNKELYSLADEIGIQTYDGMDVGPIK